MSAEHSIAIISDMKASTIIICILLAVLALAVIFTNAMTKPPSRDEQMYCTAAVLMNNGKIPYRDFSYVAQGPYHPLLLSFLYKFTPTNYLLAGRTFSVMCNFVTILCISGVFIYIFRPLYKTALLLGSSAVILYLFNPIVCYANGHAWNHDIVIMCVSVSFLLYITMDFKKRIFIRAALIGILLTAAAFMRLTTSLIYLIFAAAVFIRVWTAKKYFFANFGSFIAGSILAAIWPLYIILSAPEAFFHNIYTIPTLNNQWLTQTGMLLGKLYITKEVILSIPYLFLILITGLLWLLFITTRRTDRTKYTQGSYLIWFISATFFIITYIPPAIWIQYFAIPVSFIVISAVYPAAYFLKNNIEKIRPAAIFFAAVTIISVTLNPTVLINTLMITEPDTWSCLSFQETADEAALHIGKDKKVLTLSPLLALQAGCSIYNELSAGSIAYRMADSLTLDQKKICHVIGYGDLNNIFKNSPPDAVLVGMEIPRIEYPIRAAAENAGYLRKNIKGTSLTVYIRPD